jgi:type IV pilus assembly protein PilW
MRGARRDVSGFTLAELLVVMAVTGVVMTGTVTLLAATQRSHAAGTARVEAQQAARAGLERMVTELREAGYDPTRAGFPAITVAEPARVVFLWDLNGNGLIDPTRERVTYLLAGAVLRRDAGGGAQPLVERVRWLLLVYFDRDGVPTTDPARVASIRIALEVGAAAHAVRLESQATLRNLPR